MNDHMMPPWQITYTRGRLKGIIQKWLWCSWHTWVEPLSRSAVYTAYPLIISIINWLFLIQGHSWRQRFWRGTCTHSWDEEGSRQRLITPPPPPALHLSARTTSRARSRQPDGWINLSKPFFLLLLFTQDCQKWHRGTFFCNITVRLYCWAASAEWPKHVTWGGGYYLWGSSAVVILKPRYKHTWMLVCVKYNSMYYVENWCTHKAAVLARRDLCSTHTHKIFFNGFYFWCFVAAAQPYFTVLPLYFHKSLGSNGAFTVSETTVLFAQRNKIAYLEILLCDWIPLKHVPWCF